MSNKLLTGILAGIVTGISITLIINLKSKYPGNHDEDSNYENDKLDEASHYLLKARNKADEIVAEAASKSSSILEEAGRILSLAKAKTSSLHFEHKETADAEINKIREEIEITIEDFKKRLNPD